MPVCVFTGHRALPVSEEVLIPLLDEAIEKLYLTAGYDTWLCGGAAGFDLLAGERVLALQKQYPALKLHIYQPCPDQDKRYSVRDKARYAALLQGAEEVRLLSPRYFRGCMLARDRAMVLAAQCCVALLTQSSGGTYYTVREAQKRGVPVYNLAERL